MTRYRLVASLAALSLALSPLRALAACGKDDANATPAQVVQAQVDAYNAHDIEAFAACYADNANVVDLGGRLPPVKGKEALRKTYAFLAKQPRDFRVEIVQRIASGPVVIDLERLHGLPAGKHVPDSTAIYEVRGGKIVNAWFPPPA